MGIAEVYIIAYPSAQVTMTANDGSFQIDWLDAGNYTVELQHPDYQMVTYELDISSGDTIIHNFALNAHPQFDSVSVTTYRIRTSSLMDTYYYQVRVFARILDPDGSTELGDSASVLWNDQIDPVIREPGTSNYSLLLGDSRFPGGAIDNMMGFQFVVRINDIHGDTVFSAPAQIPRYITSSIEHSEPDIFKGNGYLQGVHNPDFIWYVPNPNVIFFDYLYRFRLFDQGTRNLLFEGVFYDTSQAITIELSEVTYHFGEDTLDFGDYFWTIQFEDFWGDISRSAELNFEIQ
jgi:hypothetical protein